MKARYIKSEHCLQELPYTPWPNADDVVDENLDGTFKERMIQHSYEADFCRKLRCSDNFKGEDGKIYEEGKDYAIGQKENGSLTAIPIESESEDEIWEEMFNDFIAYGIQSEEKMKKIVKSKFTITRRKGN